MIYLDYQATTPVAPEVGEAMRPWVERRFGNPHSPHRIGREAALDLESDANQVSFSGGGPGSRTYEVHVGVGSPLSHALDESGLAGAGVVSDFENRAQLDHGSTSGEV